ncbi:MAG: SDR family NAD(P)-dependent oxidoreductase, partial [Gaiellaceae bacterium]
MDAALIAVAWKLAWTIRFDPLNVPVFYRDYLSWQTILVVIALKSSVFVLFGFYNRWWRYVSTRDMWGAARGVLAASILVYSVFYFVPYHDLRMPRGIAVLDMLLLLAFVATSRMLARTVMERPAPGRLVARGKEVVVVGAGDAGQLVLRELLRNRALGYTPIGLVDDDPRKRNMRLHGVRVLGTSEDLPRILRENRPDELLIAIPSASGEHRRQIVEAAQAAGVIVKTLPGLHELISGDVDLAGQIRPVQVEDVLGREPVEVDLQLVASYLDGETVLVTGAGGSIGAELCRQISRLGPSRIVLVENSEAALFEIERELVDERGYTAAAPVLGDVKDRAKLRQVFEKYRPGVVFHAAAYKHVPLLEANPLECVRNNIVATRVVADAAVEWGAKRFVLVSSDKAASPKNLMGQSKA